MGFLLCHNVVVSRQWRQGYTTNVPVTVVTILATPGGWWVPGERSAPATRWSAPARQSPAHFATTNKWQGRINIAQYLPLRGTVRVPW